MDYFVSIFLLVVTSTSVIAQTCVSPTTRCNCFEESGKKIINCRYKNLTEIPTFTNTGQIYDEIRFTHTAGTCSPTAGCNNIRQIGANAFANLKVKKIDLRQNALTSIDHDAFRGLAPELEAIAIEGDGFNEMPYSALAVLDEHLKSLHLVKYGSTRIESPIVFPFPNLESLTLEDWTNLSSIDADLFYIMQNLKELKLAKLKSLQTLPVAAIQKFLKLTTLEITANHGLTSIYGDSFTPLSQLNDIKIHNNPYLNYIDQRAFHGVTDTVSFLDLGGNNLNSTEFLRNENWTVISHLDIGYNYNLRTLPNGIFSKLPTLDYLACQDIGLTSINKDMLTGLSNLHTIDLAYNRIKTVFTEAFKNSPALIELRLHDQDINSELLDFQDGAFNGIETSLETLVLDGTKFDASQFWNDLSKLSELKALEIKNTGIDNIPDKAFRNNTELNTLLMSGNKLTVLKQETFFGPRYTLQTIDVMENLIHTVDQCTLSDFPTKPTLTLSGNKLNCNCDLVWLYDWFKTQSNQAIAASIIGSCTLPNSLANKTFTEFSRSDMCPGGAPVRTCPDLYATTTSSSTTSTITVTTTQPHTTAPLPPFELRVINQDTTSVEVAWVINDRTHVTGLKLEMKSNYQATKIEYPGLEAKSFTFYQLLPDTYYTFCLVLKIENEYRDAQPDCQTAQTSPLVTDPTSTTEISPEPESQIGVIVGASVGGVVLVALLIAILVIVLKTNKPKKPLPEPGTFTMKADVPHAGGTARRFAKKPEKEGATPDDINITVISNGEMTNRDRISAGSYQAINEKGVDTHPMPSTSGHYANSWEERPLPKAPYGSQGASGHGYVNDGFKNSSQHLPETSKNEYSEVRY